MTDAEPVPHGSEDETMAQRGKQSFEKRQREMDRKDRARQKEARRQERREDEGDDDAVDEAALYAQYGRLAERHAAGEIDDERFTTRKREIFEALGLDAD